MFHGIAYQNDLLKNINFLHLELYECAEVSFSCSLSNTNFFNRLFCVLESTGKSFLEQVSSGKRLTLKPGCIYFISAADELFFNFEPETHFYSFHFNVFPATGEELFFQAGLLMEECGNEAWIHEVTEIFAAPQTQTNALRMESMLLQKIAHFLPNRSARDANVFSLAPALHMFLRKEANAQTTLADLAEIAGVSVDTLSRRFSQYNHFTLKSFLNHSVAARAECLLRNPDLKIKDVAKKLNFTSEYYFSRFFKRETSQTPREFRISSCRRS